MHAFLQFPIHVSRLIKALRNHLINVYRDDQAQRRGGNYKVINLDTAAAEAHLATPTEGAPERLFDREWAVAVVEREWERLQQEYNESGKGELFTHLHEAVEGRPGGDNYAQAASTLGMKDNAVRVAAQRLRSHYRTLLEEEVADLLTTPTAEEVDAEIRYLFQALVST